MWNNFTKASEKAGFSIDNYFDKKLTRSEKILQQYVTRLGDATGSIEDFAEQSNSIASDLLSVSLKRFGLETLITAVSAGALYGINYLITAKTRVKEIANEIKESHATTDDAIKNNIQSVNDITSDFEQLSRGVDEYGNNISLTNEQYEKYKNICQTLAEINPSLVKAYDSEGQAIINKNEAISKTIELLQQEQELENRKFTSNENLETIVEDTFNDIGDLEEKLRNVMSFDLSDYSNIDLNNYIKDAKEAIEKAYQRYIQNDELFSDDEAKAIGRIRQIFESDSPMDYIANSPTEFLNLWSSVYEKIERYYTPGAYKAGNSFANLEGLLRDQREQISIIENDIDSYYKSYASIGTIYASTLDDFDKLSDEQKSILNSMINAFDYESMVNEADGNEKKFVADLKSRVSSLVTLIGNDPEISNLISQLFKIDTSKLNYSEYSKQIQQVFQKIAETATGQEAGTEIPISLGFTVADDGAIESEVDEIYSNVFERLKQKFSSTDTSTLKERSRIAGELSKLTVDELRTLYNTDIEGFGSLNEILENLRGKSTGFSISDYTDEIDKLQDTLKNLGDAISKLASNSLNAQDTVDLLQAFPELSNYTSDIGKGLMEIAKSSPDELIAKLQSIKDTMTGDTSEIERVISLIKQMRDEALGLSKNGLIDYGKAKIQDVIDELEKANTELQKEKDTLDKISDKYSKAQNAVTTVLQDEINSLKDSQTTITDYYNNQIDLLKAENEEREKNIELQEKQKALDDAKRNKVRVYSAARGWTIQSDTEAITKAQNDLDATVNNNQIAEFEEKRDKQSETIQGQIDSIENYLKLWEEATSNNASALADIQAAEELIGQDWKKAITNGDLGIINTFKAGYEANEIKVNETQAKIDAKTAKIDQCNTSIEKIGELLNDEETGLSSIWAAIDPTNLNTENLGTNLEKLYNWVTSMFGDPSLDEYDDEQQAQQDALNNAWDYLNAGAGPVDPQILQNETINKVLNTTPGMSITDNAAKGITPLLARPVVQGSFSPTITNNFNANHVDDKVIANWWDRMLDNEYSKFQAGKK